MLEQPSTIRCSSTSLAACTEEQICRTATRGDGRWNRNSATENYVLYAQKAGMDCLSASRYMYDNHLCRLATGNKRGFNRNSVNNLWTRSDKYQRYVTEAKKRGLTCGVNVVTTTNFKQAFITQPKLKRQQLQYALKKLGHYPYGIDGLWGKGTSSGFDKFVISSKLQTQTEKKVFDTLLSRVKPPSSFGCQVDPKICAFTNSYLCSRATGSNLERKYWIANGYAEQYVKEAKRRKLSCGVGKISQPIKKVVTQKMPSQKLNQKKVPVLQLKKQLKRHFVGGL